MCSLIRGKTELFFFSSSFFPTGKIASEMGDALNGGMDEG